MEISAVIKRYDPEGNEVESGYYVTYDDHIEALQARRAEGEPSIETTGYLDPNTAEGTMKDAARYRWLNKQHNFIIHIESMDHLRHYNLKCGGPLDTWIDARLEAERTDMNSPRSEG